MDYRDMKELRHSDDVLVHKNGFKYIERYMGKDGKWRYVYTANAVKSTAQNVASKTSTAVSNASNAAKITAQNVASKASTAVSNTTSATKSTASNAVKTVTSVAKIAVSSLKTTASKTVEKGKTVISDLLKKLTK